VGTWSRYPIAAQDEWADLQPSPRWQYTRLLVEGQPVHVVNLHLAPPKIVWRHVPFLPFLPRLVPAGQRADDRQRHVDLLAPRLHALSASGDPVIVAGDLNMTDQAPEFGQLLGAGYADAYRQAGWGFGLTFPAGPVAVFFRRPMPAQPIVAIDHVLVSPGIAVRQIRVWPTSGGSDHRPLVADLVVPVGRS
jgi:endonuclease/exonuclease/phosphatase family metal-dependent hydrolase